MSGEPIVIDGSTGEGGGQILRTSLALSAVTGKPLKLINIRKQRKNPGLGNQHLTCVRALAEVTDAQVQGDRLGSMELLFFPSALRGGRFCWDVAEERGSAGSVTLILQALLPVLAFAPEPSRVTLKGGTHVPLSPPVEYVSQVFLPIVRRIGIQAQLTLTRAGWYPKGGGEVELLVEPKAEPTAQRLVSRGRLREIRGYSLVSNLSLSIAQRQQQAASEALSQAGYGARIECSQIPSLGQGTCLILVAECEESLAGASSLGKPGKPAEEVGKEAAKELIEFLRTDAALDPHLADQMVNFLALAKGTSQLSTCRITSHLLTNLTILKRWFPLEIHVEGEQGQPGQVTLQSA